MARYQTSSLKHTAGKGINSDLQSMNSFLQTSLLIQLQKINKDWTPTGFMWWNSWTISDMLQTVCVAWDYMACFANAFLCARSQKLLSCLLLLLLCWSTVAPNRLCFTVKYARNPLDRPGQIWSACRNTHIPTEARINLNWNHSCLVIRNSVVPSSSDTGTIAWMRVYAIQCSQFWKCAFVLRTHILTNFPDPSMFVNSLASLFPYCSFTTPVARTGLLILEIVSTTWLVSALSWSDSVLLASLTLLKLLRSWRHEALSVTYSSAWGVTYGTRWLQR